ncbi:glycoside hydrolase family 43 protein [Sphingomonas yunnanensis]|uniref:glycoside hydrolase family 43 protein n=1 Tax=Sphingomonas yunnanensis TaxID=310400 RepID=UPI001CA6ABC9|nr:glycoside hydrolase family 43 protein [Sphingomonas yunnanensis]MBY9061377.1 glycoside hydrolase family 43 protein [Sphingomonas yunnanensis]
MRRVTGQIGTGAAALLTVISATAAAQVARFERFTYEGRTQEQAPLSSGQYRNPILSGYYPDPSVTRVGDDYYLVNSSFAHFPGLPVFHSKNLVDWTQIGNAIDRPDQLDLTGRRVSEAVFAPDISYHAGVFYIANTCVSCGGNFVITARDPSGPWSQPIWLPFEGIDPSIFWEGDRAYIINNRAPNEPPRYDGHRALWVQEYDWRAGKMVGESTQLVNGGVDLATKPVWIEGPHLLKRDGFYYLTAAEGGTGDNHSQVVFRASALRGPFTPYSGNPILTQRDLAAGRAHPVTSAGHAKLVQTQNGDWWATFLATRPYADGHYNIGRETFLLPVTWRDGWPHILERGRAIPFTAPRPRLPAGPAATLPTGDDFGYVDEFDGGKLAMQWIGIRTPRQPFYRLAGGALELRPAARFGDLSGTPAFLGRRQQHHVATISTVLRFDPHRDGARAGLAAVQNDRSLLEFAVARVDGRTVVALYQRDLADSDTLVASAPVDVTGTVTLTIRADGGTMAFDYTVGRQKRTLTDRLDSTFLSTQRAGGFVGTVIGPFVEAP